MSDKRNANRTTLRLRTRIVEKGSKQEIGLLRANIGFGGLGGYTREQIEVGAAVTIEIFFPQRSGGDLVESISGSVSWVHQDGNFNAIGIMFLPPPGVATPHLESYLQYADQMDSFS
ncbi:MAG: PilZ domain-containing protein [Nitrospiria bacterium]